MLEPLHLGMPEGYGVHAQQKLLLKTKCNCTGLNSPSRVLLWVRVSDISTAWEVLKEDLHFAFLNIEGHQRPEITQQLQVLLFCKNTSTRNWATSGTRWATWGRRSSEGGCGL